MYVFFLLQGDRDNPKVNAMYIMKGSLSGECMKLAVLQQYYEFI